MAEDDMMEFIGGETRDTDIGRWTTAWMTLGKQYKVWCDNDLYVVIRDDMGQWRMFPHSWFSVAPLLTDSGALEYEEIMASLGESHVTI